MLWLFRIQPHFKTGDSNMNSFQFSRRTQLILKSFSKINQSMVFKPGQEIRTISPGEDMIGVARIAETIPMRFAIYDLERFLKLIKDDSVLIPHEDHLEIINKAGSSIIYHCCPANVVLQPPEEDLDIRQVVTRFELPNVDLQDLQSVMKVLSTYGSSVRFTRQDRLLTLEVRDDQSTYRGLLYRKELANKKGINFKARTEYNRLRVLFPADYTVSIVNGNAFAVFESEDDIKYYIALDELTTSRNRRKREQQHATATSYHRKREKHENVSA
jgi:hypothetical protein